MMMLDHPHHSNNSTRVSSSSQQPADVDVLCGKDKTYAKHPGNILYRNLIQAMSRVYTETPTKQDKMRMTAEIVHTMKVEHGSRFLKMVAHASNSSNSNNNSGWCTPALESSWEELSVTAARDKTSHALRFCAANPHQQLPTTTTTSSSSRASPPMMVVSPAVAGVVPSRRRSLRALQQRRRQSMHRHHRRTVSSEKIPLLPYTTVSSSDYKNTRDETTRPLEAYSMPQSYELNGMTTAYYANSDRHCENNDGDHYRNSNWYNTPWDTAGTADHDDANTTSTAATTTTTTNLDDTDSCMVTPDAVWSRYELSSVTVIPNVSSDSFAAAVSAAPVRMAPRLEPPSNTLLNDEEDLDAILREPLNWDEMENDDLFFL